VPCLLRVSSVWCRKTGLSGAYPRPFRIPQAMTTDPIRAALERLISAYDEHGGRWPDHHVDALHNAVKRARADLAAADTDPANGDNQPPVMLTEEELAKSWNQQADEFNRWDSLDSGEQLAWAQARAIARDRADRLPDPAGGGEALLAAPAAEGDGQRSAVLEAVGKALGNAYDCLRVWEAWSVGTMGPDDFALVAEDDARLAEIADAAIQAMRPAAPADGEAGKLAASLRRIAPQNPMGIAVQAIASSATLLEQLATAPTAPPKGEAGELVAWLNDGELVAWLNNHAAHLRTMEGIGALPETELQERLDRAATLLQQQAAELAALRAGVVLVAIPGEQWHEGDGPCLWWRFPINEPPWSGDPRDDDWPGYHTHFTRIACPVLPSPQGENPSIITPQP
jgi:hypothetical protein